MEEASRVDFIIAQALKKKPAIVKEPTWATATEIPSPALINNTWIEQPDNPRKITIWENFNKELIIEDLYKTLDVSKNEAQ